MIIRQKGIFIVQSFTFRKHESAQRILIVLQ